MHCLWQVPRYGGCSGLSRLAAVLRHFPAAQLAGGGQVPLYHRQKVVLGHREPPHTSGELLSR